MGVQPQVFEAATEIKIANRNLRGNGAKLSGVIHPLKFAVILVDNHMS